MLSIGSSSAAHSCCARPRDAPATLLAKEGKIRQPASITDALTRASAQSAAAAGRVSQSSANAPRAWRLARL